MSKFYIELSGEEEKESKTKLGKHKWEKQNLMTQKDRSGLYDLWKCIYCKKEYKRYGISDFPVSKCKKAPKEKRRRLGWWIHKKYFKESKCPKCGAKSLVVPKKKHSLAKYWKLKRNKNDLLVVCPDGCLED